MSEKEDKCMEVVNKLSFDDAFNICAYISELKDELKTWKEDSKKLNDDLTNAYNEHQKHYHECDHHETTIEKDVEYCSICGLIL